MGEYFSKIPHVMEKYLIEILKKKRKKHARYGNEMDFLT